MGNALIMSIPVKSYITFGLFLFVELVFNAASAFSQDPTFISFSSNRSLYNPAMVGYSGAQSIQIKGKSQWQNDGGGGYRTLSMIFEETVPCSLLDFGGKLLLNEEGSGLYRTGEVGILSSIYLPLKLSKSSAHNVRIGLDASWGINSINFDKLIFSDQLDPKYGPINPTGFVLPGENSSNTYATPGFGLVVRSLWNKLSSSSIASGFGVALYRFYNFSENNFNQSVSILGLNNSNGQRLTAFLDFEFSTRGGLFKNFLIKPQFFYQKQGVIDYGEIGSRFSLLRDLGLTLLYHTDFSSNTNGTKWVSANFDFVNKFRNNTAIGINLGYAMNLGGLSNLVGPQFELGVSLYLAKSSICKLLDKDDAVPYNQLKCPFYSLSRGQSKLYENIWY